jgi:hypothetical protein
MEITLLALVAVIFTAFSATVAGEKGYSQASWAWAGLFFGPIALLAAMGLPDLKLRKYIRLLAEHQGAVAVEPREAVDVEPNAGDSGRVADVIARARRAKENPGS